MSDSGLNPFASSWPAIDPAIEVLPGTDVTDAWDRFEVFEALHHSLAICNPMTSDELNEVIDACQPATGARILDVGCGSGETLIRCAERARTIGTGIDLSPWMITAALARATNRMPDANLQWVLGEGRDYEPNSPADLAICIGAEWVWRDFKGTARALARRLTDGGVAAIGAARLHHDANGDSVRAQRGHVETVDDMRATLQLFGLEPVHRVDPDDAGWDAYLASTADAAADWAEKHPGQRADKWLEEQADWNDARERDRDVIGWSVWIAQKSETIE